MRVLPTWRKGMIPENWFYHHTLLAARQVEAKPPDAEHDLLVTAGPTSVAAYIAIVRALRNLPRQHAFLERERERVGRRARCHAGPVRAVAGDEIAGVARRREDAATDVDVPGAGLGHATVWRDEPDPPAGRGVARTGVSVVLPSDDMYARPMPVREATALMDEGRTRLPHGAGNATPSWSTNGMSRRCRSA